jgi:hypothetical protein
VKLIRFLRWPIAAGEAGQPLLLKIDEEVSYKKESPDWCGGVASICGIFSGCAAGISQEDYDAAVSERDTSQAQVASLEAKLTLAEDQIAVLESDLAAAQG